LGRLLRSQKRSQPWKLKRIAERDAAPA